jgi:protein-tyrosine phosphatase
MTLTPIRMIDFHNHVLPGVDDGAADAAEASAAVRALMEQGVTALVVTPHVNGSDTERSVAREKRLRRIDRAWEALQTAVGDLGVALHRGAEVMLDTPEPDLSDPRLRLGGTRFVLVEFPFLAVPPNATRTLFQLKVEGWEPIIAHPERYANPSPGLAEVEEWKRVGARLQVNAGSLVGRYGSGPRLLAWTLLERGVADYVASDFHSRGSPHLAACRAAVEARGGAESARLLLETNAARLLDGEAPLAVPPVPLDRAPLWRRLFGGAARR